MTVDPLKEAKDALADQKARNSDLSNALAQSSREIKALQDLAAAVGPLADEIAALKVELASANQQIAGLSKAAADAEVNTSRDAKRADAFLAIRAALETK